MIKGYVHSIQTLGTLDGPGVRFVVFTQGCNLRCSCCHNPDTWNYNDRTQFAPEEIVKRVKRYKEYFGDEGGITFSGGEPLLQADFVYETFRLCHLEGINTCLDTSGSVLNDSVVKLLGETDVVLLDVKYTSDDLYKKHVGCDMDRVLRFLDVLQERNIKTIIRQVVIPTVNDYEENFLKLKELVDRYTVVQKVELLPFKNICTTKYDMLNIDFPFRDIPLPKESDMQKYQNMVKNTLPK
ncbi:MAG: pyruvate formate lyase-activating protein [Clostridia bacterium]|nr:pyruvate formate lyase-activating protein [Clostridia bacterium]